MDPTQRAAIEQFINDLNALRLRAGSPSIGDLVRLSDRKLAKSTLHDHLSGRRDQLPPWRLVSAYVRACIEAAEATGLEVEPLGTLDEWLEIYDVASRKAKAGSERTSVEDGVPSHESLSADPSGALLPKVPPTIAAETVRLREPDPVASVAPVLKRLEERLSELQDTLGQYDAILVVTSGPNIGSQYLITHNITTIGRDPESDIWLNVDTVSRRHAEVQRYGDQFVVRDVGSRNGTFINRTRVESQLALKSHAELHIAKFTLVFVQGSTGRSTARRPTPDYRPVRERLIAETSASTATLGPAFGAIDDVDHGWDVAASDRPAERVRRWLRGG